MIIKRSARLESSQNLVSLSKKRRHNLHIYQRVIALSVAKPSLYCWRPNYSVIQWAGMGLMVAALIWVTVAQSQMGASWRIGIDHENKTEFIQKGLFKYSRNPIFVGVIFISLGFFLVLPNPLTLMILTLDIALIQVQVAMEEDYLTGAHGKSYIDYCTRVKRWL